MHPVEPPAPPPSFLQRLRTLPPRMVGRLLLFFAIVVGLFLLRFTPLAQYMELERIRQVMDSVGEHWWAPLALLGATVLVSVGGLPISPMVLVGGAVFGTAAGSLYNVLGLFLGAAASYFIAQSLGREFVLHVAGDRLRRMERMFDRQGFWPLVQLRFMPLPFPLINYGAALAGVKPRLFFAATAVGLTPATVMHTFFASALIRAEDPKRLGILALYLLCWGAFALVTGFPTLRRALRRRQRLRELRESRGRAGR